VPKFNSPVAYHGNKSSQKKTGRARFATQAEAEALTADDLIISPLTLSQAIDDVVPDATQTVKGKVELATAAEMSAGTDESRVPAVKVAFDYINSVAIAGAPAWSETVSGIGQLSTTAEAQGATNDNTAMTPLKVAQQLAAPPAIGGTTPAAGSFTTLAATGAIDFDAGGSIESGGANDINIGADANTDAINIGTGAAARNIIIGNNSGATSVAINTGTGNITLTTAGTGDIVLNSDDTMLLDADGVLELNSSGGAISIGNDADAQAINVGTGAAARTITVGNNTGATQLVFEAGSGGLDIATAASAQSVTIGNNTGATAIVMEVGTGNFTLDGVGASTYTIGADTTSGTITIGGTAQTGTLGLGVSSGIMTTNLATGNGAKTLNVATGISGNTVNLGTGANSGVQVVNISSGASAANSTVNILTGNGSAGTQTLNALTGTRAGALNLATGAAAHVIAIGSASAGAVTVDTAAGISLDGATASNFSTSGAGADLTLVASAGRVIVDAGEDAADAIYLHANAGTSETIRLHSDQGTGVGSVTLESDVGGITLTSGLASSDAINLVSSSGGIDCDAALDIVLTSTENAADSIYLHANGGINEQIRLHSDQGTGVGSVTLESDVGGITLVSGLASADAINLTASAGGIDMDGALQVNIASSQAATGAVTIAASNAAGNITMTGAVAGTPDSITSDNAGVAASVNTLTTLITTDGDSNEDNVTLIDGLVAGQIKHFAVVAAGNAADSVKITPSNMAGGSKITFAADPTGLGCTMVFDGTNWCVVANNGGTIA